ncbi:ParA family protein [Mucilaginibacter myungsuensis]|uniref:ParA family protein n=1 Tax=Mucilaginibacter myungsuensis TaxID=649104 RepID=A0A929PVM4_9SPHI|nr:ParA family protein [Mucilaginibacter myungsuensis]MBE9661923.1 ParA family protein [Mucilaginibacter myungsuensis]MDN3599643.1 ParA family protein [Mucilaginibacter myungsuensis]
MINIYKEISKLSEELQSLVEHSQITDYRIYLKSNNTVTTYIVSNDNISGLLNEKFDNPNIEFEFFEDDDIDNFLHQLYFKSQHKINIIDSNRRLVNLLDEEIAELPNSNDFKFPIATFYSYKGGVGRSTTLAACASYLAIHYSKKIVVIDCDFEAPGFTNFFLNDPGVPFYNNGVIEYFLDKEFCQEDLNIRNYLWEASKEFSGQGEIYVMPSGNLNDVQVNQNEINDRVHYLQGLGRIDFSEKTRIIERFKDLISAIDKELHPDIILLDSRTGFNDIFGLTAFQLSNIVIGFFGSNVQTLPGIHFFIDSILKRNQISGLIVNSIIPASNKRRWFKLFKEDVENYITSVAHLYQPKNDEQTINSDLVNIEMYPVTRHEILESLGTRDDDKLDFVDFIESKTFSDYVDLFEKINSLLEDHSATPEVVFKSTDQSLDPSLPEDKSYPELSDDVVDIEEFTQGKTDIIENQPETTDEILEIKKRVLLTLQDKMPELYAEDIKDFDKEYKEGRYFYRKCMLDIFNLDKFIVLGNKGTGKTYIYRSLRQENIVNELKLRANKTNIDYQFIQLIFKGNYFIDTTKFDGREVFSVEKYYERFWQVYIWNVLLTELKSEINYKSNVSNFQIADNTETTVRFHDIIIDDLSMIEIERDLDKIDALLKSKGDKHIIIIFDELDHVVRPHRWSERVAPLINLCKKFSYSRIYPKLFLRSDLFEKISNVNNIQALNNRSIKIEWDREELFAYFFKVILSHSKEDFFTLMKEYGHYPSFHINKIRRTIELHGKQPPTDDYILRHLTSTFFGKYADVNNTPHFGESYDWFFRNLKNANETISLRPFIDLISEAVKWAISEDKRKEPILPQFYYSHGRAREKAVERHFQDLAKEKGNGDLIYIFKYLKDDADSKFKVLELQQREFYQLLDLIIEKYPDLENRNKENLVELLKVNGIIVDRIVRFGYHKTVQKRYRFALLYKYYLGLKNN